MIKYELKSKDVRATIKTAPGNNRNTMFKLSPHHFLEVGSEKMEVKNQFSGRVVKFNDKGYFPVTDYLKKQLSENPALVEKK